MLFLLRNMYLNSYYYEFCDLFLLLRVIHQSPVFLVYFLSFIWLSPIFIADFAVL